MTPSSDSSPTPGTPNLLRDRAILVTGGSGSFGRRFVHTVLKAHGASRVVVPAASPGDE